MSAQVWGCQSCPAVVDTIAAAEEHADTTGHILVNGHVVEPERVGPTDEHDLSAPEIAILRMATVIEATGVRVTDGHLVERTVAARGILLNPGNRNRYATVLANLVGAGLLRTAPPTVASVWTEDNEIITITGRGRRALEQQNGRTT